MAAETRSLPQVHEPVLPDDSSPFAAYDADMLLSDNACTDANGMAHMPAPANTTLDVASLAVTDVLDVDSDAALNACPDVAAAVPKGKSVSVPADASDSLYNTPSYDNASTMSQPKQKGWLRRKFEAIVPYGGFVSNCFSLGSVTLGGGIISMPSSFATSGIVMAVLYLLIITALTVYTMALLSYVFEKTGCRTFESAARLLFGRGGDYLVGGVNGISCFGTAIAYVSAVSGLLYPIVQHSPNAPAYLKTESGNRLLTALVWLCCMLPIIIPKRLNSIRYVALVGCVMVLYFVCVIVVHSSTNGLQQGMRGDMRLFTTGNKAIYGLSIFVFAYMCQCVTPSVYFEMRPRPSVRQLTLASAVALTTVMLFYMLAGFFGYMDFGDDTQDSVLYNFDPVHNPYVMVAYVGMLIKLCAAYALNMIPCRNFVYHCVRWDIDTLPYWKHALASALIGVAGLVLGLFIPSVNTAFGLVGSFCGGFIGFLWPALFYMYLGNWSRKTVGWFNYIGTYFLILSGVIAICFGTIATIYSSFIDT